ncbi:MAG: hypothetical protein Q4A28_06180 [Brachymonas sp.]|nr:hypothetical protein [Brachymonas sp.]
MIYNAFRFALWGCYAFVLWLLVTAKPEIALLCAILGAVFWFMTRPEKQN